LRPAPSFEWPATDACETLGRTLDKSAFNRHLSPAPRTRRPANGFLPLKSRTRTVRERRPNERVPGWIPPHPVPPTSRLGPRSARLYASNPATPAETASPATDPPPAWHDR